MSIQAHRQTFVAIDRRHGIHRRDFLRGIAASSVAAGMLGWTDLLCAESSQLRKRGKACILLYMQGGPSQFETFSPLPGHANGGETKAIPTAVPGIQIAENFPEVAKVMGDVAIIRSMTGKEGAHPRATFLMHTGYLPTASVKYPAFGAVVAEQLRDAQLDLPAFVRVGGNGNVQSFSGGGGYLGNEFDPFMMAVPGKMPTNTQPGTDSARFSRRMDLLERLEGDYAASQLTQEVADHGRLYRKTQRMIQSDQMKAFDFQDEPAASREAYGSGPFAEGCLLARRLVETGVTFVEVFLNGWDTHADNFSTVRKLAGQSDRAVAQLIRDLKQRGLLDSTLVAWAGEFGRTPRINPRGGRDHYPKAFNVALAGCGIRGGQVIGKLEEDGSAVADRPVSIPDLFSTMCKSLGINAGTEHMTNIGRPIKIVDGGTPVDELFG
jgi:hypothetical protein